MEERAYAGDIAKQWGNDPVVNLRFGPVRKAFDEDPLAVSRKVSPFRVFRRPPFQWENPNLSRLPGSLPIGSFSEMVGGRWTG